MLFDKVTHWYISIADSNIQIIATSNWFWLVLHFNNHRPNIAFISSLFDKKYIFMSASWRLGVTAGWYQNTNSLRFDGSWCCMRLSITCFGAIPVLITLWLLKTEQTSEKWKWSLRGHIMIPSCNSMLYLHYCIHFIEIIPCSVYSMKDMNNLIWSTLAENILYPRALACLYDI